MPATRKLSDNFDGSPSAKKRDFFIEFKLNCINKAKIIFHMGVLFEREHYYAILAEEGRTIRLGVVIEKGALIEGVRYFMLMYKCSKSENSLQKTSFIEWAH